MLALYAPLALALHEDLAQPHYAPTKQLSASPNVWMTPDFIEPKVSHHMRSLVPKDEAAYEPCIGQKDEFEFKRCTLLTVAGDQIMEDFVLKVGKAWGVDTKLLLQGLPLIRYLPGSPPVGKHGDEDRRGVVPNATLVLYLTDSHMTGGKASGQTVFPEAELAITPQEGSIISFQNVDETGAPHPKAKHYVGAVPADAKTDRLVVQIPIAVAEAHGKIVRKWAYPEHVSGNKKPGEHESMHGTAEQIAAYQAAIAAGMALAVAFMAAKKGAFDPTDEPNLTQMAKDTGKFSDADFVAKS